MQFRVVQRRAVRLGIALAGFADRLWYCMRLAQCEWRALCDALDARLGQPVGARLAKHATECERLRERERQRLRLDRLAQT